MRLDKNQAALPLNNMELHKKIIVLGRREAVHQRISAGIILKRKTCQKH
jgi:hypothetical protein